MKDGDEVEGMCACNKKNNIICGFHALRIWADELIEQRKK